MCAQPQARATAQVHLEHDQPLALKPPRTRTDVRAPIPSRSYTHAGAVPCLRSVKPAAAAAATVPATTHAATASVAATSISQVSVINMKLTTHAIAFTIISIH
eukprot:6182826-Pleurochrysis_carterae.AAC.1